MATSPDDIKPLIEGLIHGEAAAQRELFKGYFDIAFREAVRVLHQQGEAYDVTAGLLLDFMTRDAQRFRAGGRPALEHYLRVSARRRAIAAKGGAA